jgi:soluble lytic murein transglycosylase
MPVFSNQVIATPTETLLPTATNTPAPTSTPTATPSPTPLPAARVNLGDRWIFWGDYDRAEQEYLLAAEHDPDPETQAAAQLGLGKLYLLRDDATRALQIFRDLIQAFAESSTIPDAYFYLGQTYSELGRYLDSAEAYEQYISLKPEVIDAFVFELIGDAYFAAAEFSQALEAYQAASNSPQAGNRTGLHTKLALAYRYNGDPGTALTIYQDIFNQANDEYTRAQMLFLSGQTYLEQGLADEGYNSYLQAVQNYPVAYDSYSALVELVNAGIPVSELDRGLVDYYAGQYAVALAAFDRYLNTPDLDESGIGEAHYFRGLTNRALGENTRAIQDWDVVIDEYPFSEYWDKAWEQKGYTQWAYLDDYQGGIQTFLSFVEKTPEHPRAEQFLDFAARVAERDGDLTRAASLWDRMTIDYPNAANLFRASFLAGITYYRLGEYESARIGFERALSQSAGSDERASALLWIGKAFMVLGKTLEAGNAWQQATISDPTGYYAERARELLKGNSPFISPLAYDFSYDQAVGEAEAETWLRTVFSLPPETDLSIPGSLGNDPLFKRGIALWELGFYDEARREFESLRLAVENDPARTYQLGRSLINLGLYRSGIFAIRQVLNLAGLDDAGTLTAPKLFNRLRFGPYYAELIIPAAQEYNLHPLFLFSLARQESLFEGFVRSSAGARGVMQIMPSTGQSIAGRMGWPQGYTEEDLYRPYISINLGTNYLAQQRDFFEGDLYAALAAYNGGPGNAQIWKELAQDDPDLFLEIIRFEETRRYIRSIYENFNIYMQLYDRSP